MELPKVKKRTLIHEGTSLRYYEDIMEFSDGYNEIWDFVEHRFNAAAVIPVLPNGNILLASQYRTSKDGLTWEIPAGKRDDDGAEDPYICAKRELKEETGYSSDNITHLMTLRPAIAYCSETIDIYIAKDCYPAGGQNLDEGEHINVYEFDLKTLKDMIKKGDITDGKTVAGVLAVDNL